MDGLTEYRVVLLEDGGSFSSWDDNPAIIFDCWADDEDHALEQADNAYPNCSIINAFIKAS